MDLSVVGLESDLILDDTIDAIEGIVDGIRTAHTLHT